MPPHPTLQPHASICLQTSITSGEHPLLSSIFTAVTYLLGTCRSTCWGKRKSTGFTYREWGPGFCSLWDLKRATFPLRTSPPSPMKWGQQQQVRHRPRVSQKKQWMWKLLSNQRHWTLPVLQNLLLSCFLKTKCLSQTWGMRLFGARSTCFEGAARVELHSEYTLGHAQPCPATSTLPQSDNHALPRLPAFISRPLLTPDWDCPGSLLQSSSPRHISSLTQILPRASHYS